MSRTFRRKNSHSATSNYRTETVQDVYAYQITVEMDEEFFFDTHRKNAKSYIDWMNLVNRDNYMRKGDMGPFERLYSRRFVRKQFNKQKAEYAKYENEESFYNDKLFKKFAWGV